MKFFKNIIFVGINYFNYFNYVQSHSWLECTNYFGDEDNFEYDKCFGLPRHENWMLKSYVFGLDEGLDHHSKDCEYDRSFSSNKATYYPGQIVKIVHPAKNHFASDTCTNPYIPDNGMWFYMSSGNDDTFDIELENITPPHTNGVVDFQGYQHCSTNACVDSDKAMCTFEFKIPDNAPEGEHSFKWLWNFNGGDDFYSQCFDVIISNDNNNEVQPDNNNEVQPDDNNEVKPDDEQYNDLIFNCKKVN